MKSIRHSAVILLSALIAGCATSWSRIDDATRSYQGEHYSVMLPAGWMRLESGGNLLLSKDGIDLQRIIIEYHTHDKAFEKLKKTSSDTMLPSELAELTIADLKASQKDSLPSLKVISNAPVEIGGHAGFLLHLGYKTDEGLRIELLMEGFADAAGYYLITYRAPALYYFERDRGAFESICASFRSLPSHRS
jgi:hypothetical protein